MLQGDCSHSLLRFWSFYHIRLLKNKVRTDAGRWTARPGVDIGVSCPVATWKDGFVRKELEQNKAWYSDGNWLIEGRKEIRTEREINNDILGAELAGYVAFGISKPGYRSTPLRCPNKRKARNSNFGRCPASVDLLDILSGDGNRKSKITRKKCTSRDQNHALISVGVRSSA